MDTPLRAELFAAVCALAACGCATVTQEDPPSNLPPGAGSGGTQSGSAGFSGGSSVPPPSNGGGPGNGGSGSTLPPSGGASGGGGQSPVAAGSGGDGGSGGSGVEPDDGFDAGTVLFEETFEDFQAADWTLASGTWAISTDPEADGNVYAQTETADSTFHLAYAGDASWRSVIVEANFKIVEFNGSSSSYMAGLCVRVSNANDFYFIGIRSNDGKVGLRSFGDEDNNIVQSDYEEGTTGVWYNLRVEVIADTVSAFLDGEAMFTETVGTYDTGGVGLCTVRASVLFDDVRVTAP